MSQSDRNAGKRWTPAEKKTLSQLARQNTPTRVISIKMGRPVAAVYTEASKQGVSLKPNNQAPYNRQSR